MRKIGITPGKIFLPNVNTPISRYIFIRPSNVQDFKIEKFIAPRDDIKVGIEQMQNEGTRVSTATKDVTLTLEFTGAGNISDSVKVTVQELDLILMYNDNNVYTESEENNPGAYLVPTGTFLRAVSPGLDAEANRVLMLPVVNNGISDMSLFGVNVKNGETWTEGTLVGPYDGYYQHLFTGTPKSFQLYINPNVNYSLYRGKSFTMELCAEGTPSVDSAKVYYPCFAASRKATDYGYDEYSYPEKDADELGIKYFSLAKGGSISVTTAFSPVDTKIVNKIRYVPTELTYSPERPANASQDVTITGSGTSDESIQANITFINNQVQSVDRAPGGLVCQLAPKTYQIAVFRVTDPRWTPEQVDSNGAGSYTAPMTVDAGGLRDYINANIFNQIACTLTLTIATTTDLPVEFDNYNVNGEGADGFLTNTGTSSDAEKGIIVSAIDNYIQINNLSEYIDKIVIVVPKCTKGVLGDTVENQEKAWVYAPAATDAYITAAHELGHAIFSFKDLYDKDVSFYTGCFPKRNYSLGLDRDTANLYEGSNGTKLRYFQWAKTR